MIDRALPSPAQIQSRSSNRHGKSWTCSASSKMPTPAGWRLNKKQRAEKVVVNVGLPPLRDHACDAAAAIELLACERVQHAEIIEQYQKDAGDVCTDCPDAFAFFRCEPHGLRPCTPRWRTAGLLAGFTRSNSDSLVTLSEISLIMRPASALSGNTVSRF
jgi:hypothetical protein